MGRHLRQRVAQGMTEESKANGQREVAPVYRLRQAWRGFPALWGEPSATVLMNVNEDGGDFR